MGYIGGNYSFQVNNYFKLNCHFSEHKFKIEAKTISLLAARQSVPGYELFAKTNHFVLT